MRRTNLAAIGAALILGLTACTDDSDPEDTTKPDTKTSTPATEPTKSTAGTPSPAPQAGGLGDAITVNGDEDGQRLSVTLKKVSDPGVPATEFNQPGKGNRLIGIELEIKNTGTAVYADTPAISTQITDTQGRQFDTAVAKIKAGPSMAYGLTLQTGDTALGWLVFEAPKTAKIASVQFGMNSGLADHKGQWKLP
ncbi:DUF4352 domain-containing protein [Streptomyces qinzhouensis]|uniref:DUF4352 domain-containing protein n=1 Tax=Streptomyces qinzhouensis TaxID=2599401 RepID=A0A5B8JQZ4_9ACTN|nr:DUF4352 domain-containing protein [Streptomyces qinzhouensis]QDY80360.1 DUF4352 domain-containing protein [Streptomyces qinzhouensis]